VPGSGPSGARTTVPVGATTVAPALAARGGRPGGRAREGARGGRPGGGRPTGTARRARLVRSRRHRSRRRRSSVRHGSTATPCSPRSHPSSSRVAEQLLRGGMPAVRAALEEQNAKAEGRGRPDRPGRHRARIAEQLGHPCPGGRLARPGRGRPGPTGEELALRDLRSVVSSADDVARDESTRELAAELKAMLEQRTESEQATWLTDIERSLRDGRVVRALRLSSRPPEPGTSFPAELTARLTEAANGALTADIAPDRWATVLDAVAYSPVRRAVVPAGIPAEPGEELVAAVRKHAGRTPAIATLFGVEPPPDRSKGRGERPARAAGRNANLSRAGGPRNATVPVPGRPGGPPVPPAKRIPPPPGRQIGATLPGSPPAVATPAAARATADPTAPLAPPSATGTGEPIASLGTPEAAPAELEPTSAPPAEGAAAPVAAAPDAAAITPDVTPPEGAAAPADAEVAAPDDAGPAALPDVAPPEGAAAPAEVEVAAPDDAGPAALPTWRHPRAPLRRSRSQHRALKRWRPTWRDPRAPWRRSRPGSPHWTMLLLRWSRTWRHRRASLRLSTPRAWHPRATPLRRSPTSHPPRGRSPRRARCRRGPRASPLPRSPTCTGS
jgi:hypothetical protein